MRLDLMSTNCMTSQSVLYVINLK